jgi:hypothetical protein
VNFRGAAPDAAADGVSPPVSDKDGYRRPVLVDRGMGPELPLLMLLVSVVLLDELEMLLRLRSSSCACATAASTAATVVMLLVEMVSVVAWEAEVECRRSFTVADQCPGAASGAGRVLRRTSVGQRVQVSFLRGNGMPQRAWQSACRQSQATSAVWVGTMPQAN